jgi:ankyrin repeat protein
MSIDFSAAGFVQRVLALGPDFSFYGTALDEKKTVDSVFLQNLSDRDIGMLFAFTPQAHQLKLERLFPQNNNASKDVPVEKPLPGLAVNSDDDDDFFLPETSSVQVAQVGSSSFEGGGGSSDDDDLFLDLNGSYDELPSLTAATKKKKKKKKTRKKKTASTPPPEKKSQGDLDTIADLDKWLSKGAPLTRKAALRTDLLVRAAKAGHTDAARALLGKPGTRVIYLSGDKNMHSALHVAALHGHSGIMHLLLAKPDVQINRTTIMADGLNAHGSTALYLASEKGHFEVVQILLDAGADIERQTERGETTLYVASGKGHFEVVQILLQAGADKEAADLGIASQFGHVEVVKILLDAGADRDAIWEGATSLNIASQEGHHEVVKMLLDAGAEKDAACPDGSTSLYQASCRNHAEVVRALLDAGASFSKGKFKCQNTGSGGILRWSTPSIVCTPLQVAEAKGHLEVVKLLLEAGAKM